MTPSENILMSNSYAAHFDALIAKLRDINAYSRNLGYLVTGALLGQLSGEHQLEAAHRVLDVIGIEQLAGIEDLPSRSDGLFEVRCIYSWTCALIYSEIQGIDGNTLGRYIVVKPSSKNTSHWLQISILALVPSIPRPQGLTINWMTDGLSVGHRTLS